MKVFLETFGCQMNRLDSELAGSALREAGNEMVEDFREADVVLFNTCSVRRHAEQKVYSRLGQVGQRKVHYPRLIVGVIGCMAQREGQQLMKDYPQVNLVCSPARLSELPELIAQAVRGKKIACLDEKREAPGTGDQGPERQVEVRRSKVEESASRSSSSHPSNSEPASGRQAPNSNFDSLDLSRDTQTTTSPAQAFVRVARGCNKFCSYCIVPYVRGPEVCRDPAHVVEEVRRLVDAGRTEITLLGQTVNSYRWADGGRSASFADLLAAVSAVPGLRRLRFVTSHPTDFGDDVLQAMRDLPNVCPYLHAPAQSGSDAMLSRMNRTYTRAQYDEFVDRARAIVPGVVLAGDFIVGFPGESEADHEASADLIRRSRYKNVFVFKYSPRPGTAAASDLPDDVPTEVKRRRNAELLAVQEEIGLAHHRGYIGQAVEVLVEGPSARSRKQNSPAGVIQLAGRTPGDHIVVFDAAGDIAGQYVQVRIVEATSLTLFGELE